MAKVEEHQVRSCKHHKAGDPVSDKEGEGEGMVWSGQEVRFKIDGKWGRFMCTMRMPELEKALGVMRQAAKEVFG